MVYSMILLVMSGSCRAANVQCKYNVDYLIYSYATKLESSVIWTPIVLMVFMANMYRKYRKHSYTNITIKLIVLL